MRKIKLIKTADKVLEGAGVHLRRAFGYYDTPLFDPFLMLDDFRNDDPEKFLAGFPRHPHRGIETITYMLAGSAEHGDSLGNSGVIHHGEVQWMTAGSGIIHQEMPKPDEKGKMYGFQLWANLPASEKMMQPRYRDIKAADIPVVITDEGAEIKIICGSFNGIKGPAEDIVIEPQYWDVSIPADKNLELPAPTGHNCFIYCYGGEAAIDDQIVTNRQVVLFTDGEGISMKALANGFKLLYICGKPINEPISWKGPIVMNTKEEIKTAFRELNEGTFIK